MSEVKTPRRPTVIRLVLAFAAVYVIWGSTYLAIRYAIETLPPFVMAGTRFLIAGSILFVWAIMHGAGRPTPGQWKAAAITGGFLLLGGNGAVVWAEQKVPSGLAALLVATEPLWIVLLDWLRPGGVWPGGHTALGMVLGFLGILLLVGPTQIIGGTPIDPAGAALLVIGSLSWAVGSLYSIRARISSSPLMGSSMQMLAGGIFLFIAASLTGEWGRLSFCSASLRSLTSLLYLVIFGSLVGFTSYTWLLRVTTPSHASTYAYVNPLVAVFLGWFLANEPVTLRTLIAAGVIISAVVIITTARTRLTIDELRLPIRERGHRKIINRQS
jgi:drug/metabolite transporter (DMT)-like permease